MAGKPLGSTARSSISSRGSPSDENAPSVPPTASYSRGSSISGAPPPIPERSTPGPGSIGRHGSLSSVSSDLPEQPTERAPTLASVGRRDSAGNFKKSFSSLKFRAKSRNHNPFLCYLFPSFLASQTSTSSKTNTSRQPPQSQTSVVEDAEDTMKNLRKTFAGIFGDM